jgi:hypothetical protein
VGRSSRYDFINCAEARMVEQSIYSIIVFNAILLIVLIAGISWWQKKYGRLTEKRLALLLTGYFNFSAITTSLPILKINIQVTIIVNLIFLAVFWGIGYPWMRWVYRQFNSSERS